MLVIKPHLEKPKRDGATALLAAEMLFRVQLWRADMLSGVLEVDAAGRVAAAGLKDQLGAFDPSLVLGMSSSRLTGEGWGSRGRKDTVQSPGKPGERAGANQHLAVHACCALFSPPLVRRRRLRAAAAGGQERCRRAV